MPVQCLCEIWEYKLQSSHCAVSALTVEPSLQPNREADLRVPSSLHQLTHKTTLPLCKQLVPWLLVTGQRPLAVSVPDLGQVHSQFSPRGW